nr:Chain I, NPM6T variant peptide [synthetic construct]4HUW_J Chain J, NPM6T variant peptide [synthetic construct]4HUW_K Chain K, NPM6T variant peptide [synthetic construct]4HUW_L Chain L, NPM6T variant peptide [synthetic construct]
ASNENTETM